MLPLGPHKQQLVLAMLLCHPNAPGSVDMLTEAVWEDEPPRTARKNLQMYVSALRKLLAEAGEADRLVHHSGAISSGWPTPTSTPCSSWPWPAPGVRPP